jgi:cephalosporin-C deacetylase-like acetyl esterase
MAEKMGTWPECFRQIANRMMKKANLTYFLLLTVLFIVAIITESYSQSNALPWSMATAYNNYLLRDVHQQYADRRVEISKAFASKEGMIAYRDDCIRRYQKIIGDLPVKGDLNAKILGTSKQDGFKVEKIIFESMPKRYVTANLYIPDRNNGPFPVALELCGHGLGGKTPASSAAILFALNGIAVMVVDPIGQGERIQFVDKNSQPLTRGATTEHTLLNQDANLLGSSLAAYEYWDNHRAIDYLETRDDIDKSRIGVYGSSGGGTQTAYLVGLEDRIMVASVCSYFTQRERVLEISGPSDGCQHIPYEGREHLEIADFVLMMAPKPVLIMSGLYDMVDYWGTLQAFAELKNTYTALGSPEKASMFTIEGGHGMPKAKREALVTWFRKWMLNDNTPIKETFAVNVPADNLRTTSTGQVITSIADQVSIPDYLLKLSEQYDIQRTEFMKKNKSEIRSKIIELLGISFPLEKIIAEQTGLTKMRSYDIIKFQIIRPGQMPVPCAVIYPENAKQNSSVVIYLNETGKADILADEQILLPFINRNDILLVADLRGYGETKDPISLNESKCWNSEYRNAMISMHIGRPIIGQRVIDIISLLDFTDSNSLLAGHKVSIVANGTYGPAVIHAVYLDQRIVKAEISRSIKSFNDYLRNPLQRDVYTNVLYGVLKYYDLKNLIAADGTGRVQFMD